MVRLQSQRNALGKNPILIFFCQSMILTLCSLRRLQRFTNIIINGNKIILCFLSKLHLIDIHQRLPLPCANTSAASYTRPASTSLMPRMSLSYSVASSIRSALTNGGAVGIVTGKGMPPVSAIWLRYIFIAVDIGTPKRDNTFSASSFTCGLTRKFKVAVFSIANHSFVSFP